MPRASEGSGLLIPAWPAPANVRALATTRQTPGVSSAPYASCNLGIRSGDRLDDVLANRRALATRIGVDSIPWLAQVHGTAVARHSGHQTVSEIQADAIYSEHPLQACAVLSADCLPLLMCTTDGREIAAVHAGWRGLLNGVIGNAVHTFSAPPEQLLVWLGAAIGPAAYEVGDEVRSAFVARNCAAADCFIGGIANRYFADLYALARQQLSALGVNQVYGGGLCTYSAPERFYSYRREGFSSGRQASLIWRIA